MALEEDLLRIGDRKVGDLTIDEGCTLVKCDKNGRREYLYIEGGCQRLTLRDCIEYFCPQPPRDIKEFYGMLLNAFSDTFGVHRDDEVREVLSNSITLLERYQGRRM